MKPCLLFLTVSIIVAILMARPSSLDARLDPAGASVESLAVVDLQQAFKDYYKTINADKKIDSSGKLMDETIKGYLVRIRKLEAECASLRQDAANVFLLDEAALGLKRKELGVREEELRQLKKDTTELNQTSRIELKKKADEGMAAILKDINEAIAKTAEARRCMIVFDSTGNTKHEVPAVLYSHPRLDITRDVIALLNRGHEAEVQAAKKENVKEK